ncbi:hypothetical protein JCM8097_004060 [Rhodosporidiobolus ruineniae]
MPQLLDLPPELLAHVFSYFEDHEKAAKRPICRALLPFTRRNLLARVQLGNFRPQRFNRFSRLLQPQKKHEAASLRATLVGDVPLGHHVRELYIPNLDKQWQGAPYVDRAPTIKRILAELKELEVLSVAGSDMAELLLPVADTWVFLKLRRLHLLELDPNRVGLYDMDFLDRLRRFPSLKWLEHSFSTYADDPEELHAEPATALNVDPFGGIDTLALCAGHSLSTSQAANFISHFTNLRTLHLSIVEGLSLFSFFGAVPSQLVHLKIEYNVEVERATIHDDRALLLTGHITRFTGLESLYLG